MKQTLNVNIGHMPFIIDQDAYNMLDLYLNDIRTRCDEQMAEETLADVEARLAELFSEQIQMTGQVVSTAMVRRAMEIIGSANDFGEKQFHSQGQTAPQPEKRRLYRSHDRVIGGVCAGLAEYFGFNLTALRIIVFLFTFFGGLSLWVYIILWILIPNAPTTLYNQ